MFERYALDSQKVLTLSESLAFSCSDSVVTEIHLFVAFLKSGETELAQFLRANGTKVLPFEALLKGNRNQEETESPFYLEYDPELTAVLEESEELSREKKEKKVSSLSLSLALIKHQSPKMKRVLSMLKVERETIVATLERAYRKSSELDSIVDLHRMGLKELDPLVGREDELQELVQALRRRNKSNAVLVGEPGVGKTHIVEHLAKMIEEGKIPELQDRKVYELDVASTVSGTKYRGEFEEKIKKIVRKVIDDGHTILFIDEIHNIVKAGGAEGAIDCANILKPYLTRGEISVIGATTLDEYEKVFSEDKALRRRFQTIKVRPGTRAEAKDILLALIPTMRTYYKVEVDPGLIDGLLDLTDRYAVNAAYPDKAIDILESACLNARDTLLAEDIAATVEKRWRVKIDMRPKAEAAVDAISKTVIGQDQALGTLRRDLDLIDRWPRKNHRPLGVFLFVGPSGVGKTETAKQIASTYFQDDLAFFRLDMADFKDAGSLTRLSGATPGYVGYKDVSPLVRQLKTSPHSLILLDEIEKAAPGVLDFFLSVFDEGSFIAGSGEHISAESSIFVLTSNYSFDSDHLFARRLSRSALDAKEIRKALEEKFRYEFLARLDDIILFQALDEKAKKGILAGCLREYSDIDENRAFELADELIGSIDSAEIERYGARALRKYAREKAYSLRALEQGSY